jgi:uncharacterized membrane protein YheB (UPF0754 family)
MVQAHEVNKRIIDEIKKYKTDEDTKQFLLDVLDFELEHFDERSIKKRIQFREDYERIINKRCKKKGE